MKSFLLLSSYMLLAFLIVGCSKPPAPIIFDTFKVEEEIKSAFNDYVEHINNQGLVGAADYFSQDQRFYWIEDGVKQYPNYQALAQGIDEFAGQVDLVDFQTQDLEVEVLDKHLGMLYVAYNQTLTLKSGFEFTLDGAMTILMHKENKSWKFLMGHSSTKKPRNGN